MYWYKKFFRICFGFYGIWSEVSLGVFGLIYYAILTWQSCACISGKYAFRKTAVIHMRAYIFWDSSPETISMWGPYCSLLSKITPRNFVSVTPSQSIKKRILSIINFVLYLFSNSLLEQLLPEQPHTWPNLETILVPVLNLVKQQHLQPSTLTIWHL